MSYAGPAPRDKRAIQQQSTVSNRLRNLDVSTSAPSPATPRWPSRTHRRDRATAFVAGIAVGLAVGAGVALLFAPQSGEDTRHDIADRGRRIARRGHDAWDDMRDELRDAWRRRRASWHHDGNASRHRREV